MTSINNSDGVKANQPLKANTGKGPSPLTREKIYSIFDQVKKWGFEYVEEYGEEIYCGKDKNGKIIIEKIDTDGDKIDDTAVFPIYSDDGKRIYSQYDDGMNKTINHIDEYPDNPLSRKRYFFTESGEPDGNVTITMSWDEEKGLIGKREHDYDGDGTIDEIETD